MIRVAVTGIGRMGGKHASNFVKGAVANAKLVAVCDTDEKVADRFRANYSGVATYTDYDEMLEKEKPDAVVIATPHYSHSELAKKALVRGISVLVEKPITVTVKDANSLIATAKAHPEAIFAIMYNQRSNSIYARAKKIIESGRLGDIQRASFTITDWYRTQYYYNMGGWRASWSGEGGGTLINQCVHQLDILQWLLGMPERIIARCKTEGRNITTENDVTALFCYKNFDCVFTASTHELPGENRFVIVGSKGTLVITRHKAVCKFLRMDEKQVNARAKRDYGNREDKKYDRLIANETNALKLAELQDKRLQNQQAMEQAKRDKADAYNSGMDNLSRTIETATKVLNSPGFTGYFGTNLNPLSSRFIPGTEAADTETLVDTLKSQGFLSGIQQMKGMGALSNAEGQKVMDAIGSLSPNQSEKSARAAIKTIIKTTEMAQKRMQQKYGKGIQPSQQQLSDDDLINKYLGGQ